MRMLALIPAALSGHTHAVVELLLGLLFLGGAVLMLAGGFWLPLRWLNALALGFGGAAAFMFRMLSHTARMGHPGLLLCCVALLVGAVAAWRLFRFTGPQPVQRVRKRKRRPRSPE